MSAYEGGGGYLVMRLEGGWEKGVLGIGYWQKSVSDPAKYQRPPGSAPRRGAKLITNLLKTGKNPIGMTLQILSQFAECVYQIHVDPTLVK